MTWIRTASSIATAVRARRVGSTGAKSLAATGAVDQVAPFRAVVAARAADAGEVGGDLASSSRSLPHRPPVGRQAGWEAHVARVPRGRWARGRRCGRAWAHTGWAGR